MRFACIASSSNQAQLSDDQLAAKLAFVEPNCLGPFPNFYQSNLYFTSE